MFNPLYPFTADLLSAFIKAGKFYFVRNSYQHSLLEKNTFLVTHYHDLSKAKAHYNSIPNDQYRFLYDWNNEGHQLKLKTAAAQPLGFTIYSSLFIPDWRKRISPDTRDKINKFMYKHTNWKPRGGDNTHINFYLQFGQLYFTLSYDHNKISGKFDALEQ